MAEPNPKSGNRWVTNTLIVIGVFLVVDLIFHFLWPTSVSYMASLPEKVLYTVIFAAIFAHIYDKASQEFHIGSNKVVNGLVFSLLFCVAIFMAVGLMLWIGSVVYIYVLHGIHGAPPPPEARQTVLTGAQVVMAGGVLSGVGKTEDNPR